jgi:hypothetical protein
MESSYHCNIRQIPDTGAYGSGSACKGYIKNNLLEKQQEIRRRTAQLFKMRSSTAEQAFRGSRLDIYWIAC